VNDRSEEIERRRKGANYKKAESKRNKKEGNI